MPDSVYLKNLQPLLTILVNSKLIKDGSKYYEYKKIVYKTDDSKNPVKFIFESSKNTTQFHSKT